MAKLIVREGPGRGTAYELVEDELITADDFRDFMFVNPVRFWGEANPNFFKDTRVEKEAAALLAR